MRSFIVNLREVHIQPVKIKAKNEQDAIKKVKQGQGDYLEGMLEYSHTLDSDTWTIEHLKS